MDIAVLGWGSLIWNPGQLKIRGNWYPDGPLLPIELMRLSSGGRITLVIYPKAAEVQTMWAYSEKEALDDAIENLRAREVTATGQIGFVTIPECVSQCRAEPGILEKIQAWAERKEVDAVIWTELGDNPDKFKDETGMEMTEDNIIKYLGSLKGDRLKAAKEYVQKAPKQVDTRLRRRIEEELGW
jgi:hypothetical protein